MSGPYSKKWPEIVLSSKETRVSQAIGRAVRNKELRKIASRIYTSNFEGTPADIIKRNGYQVLGMLFPGAVISHRSALEGGISSDGNIVLSYKYTRTLRLPALTVRLVKGPPPDEEDTPFLENLYIASRARAFLENLQPTRRRGGYIKILPKRELESRLDRMIRIYGEGEPNRLRDAAKGVSKRLKMEREFRRLDTWIGALLGTRDAKVLVSDVAKARAQKEPYDPARIELFATLAAFLQQRELPRMPSTVLTKASLIHQAFFEAYFSNYIEGTEFEIEEAEKIVFESKIFSQRREDSHDILSTYEIVSDKREMRRVPQTKEDFILILCHRHSRLMAAREDKQPGRFKEMVNRAGSTIFVHPEEVRGTLFKGFELYQQLNQGLARALFMMFLVAEVHPFVDGNGRLARMMMSAELDVAKEARIMIPTVYREDYLLALRRLSQKGDPAAYVRMMLKAQAFNASIDYEDYAQALLRLRSSNAFLRAKEGKLIFRFDF